MPKLTPKQRNTLRIDIAEHFKLEELKTLCFDLGVKFDNLGGEGLDTKVISLIEWFEDRDRTPELLAKLRKERPNFDWDPRPDLPPPLLAEGPESYLPKPRRSCSLVIVITAIIGVVTVGIVSFSYLLPLLSAKPPAMLTWTPTPPPTPMPSPTPMPIPTLVPTFTQMPTRTPGSVLIRLTPTQMPPTSSPAPTSSPTPTLTPTPTVLVVDTMDSLAGWIPFSDPRSVITPTVVAGLYNKAIQLNFDLKPNGSTYVGIGKAITPTLLTGTQAMRFHYQGTDRNTIELKLFYSLDPGGEVFSYARLADAGIDDWLLFEQRYEAFDCGDTCKTPGERVDPAQVRKLEIAVSHQLGGAPGVGRVLVDQLEALKTFPCASCAGCVTGRGYGCLGNMAYMSSLAVPSDPFCTDTFILSSPITATQILIEMTKRAMEGYGYSLYDVAAYAPGDDKGENNLLIGGMATPSSTEDGRYIAPNAIDDEKVYQNRASRWASAKCCAGESCPRDNKGNLICDNADGQDPQSLEITLPQPARVDRIVLKWEQAYATEYCVIVKPAQ